MATLSDTTVVLPTLNEADNIRKVVGSLLGRYSKIHIIVADDGSADGTVQAVKRISLKNRNVRLLDRRNRPVHGLAASIMDAALLVRTPNMVVMDADMQHPVGKVGELAEKLSEAELVIGVRTRVRNWGFWRRLVSKTISFTAYAVFKIRGKPTSNDMMSGFFAIKTGLLRDIVRKDRKGFVERGYKVLLDILKMAGSRTTIAEVNYSTFHDRTVGKSKLAPRHMLYTLASIFG